MALSPGTDCIMATVNDIGAIHVVTKLLSFVFFFFSLMDLYMLSFTFSTLSVLYIIAILTYKSSVTSPGVLP